MDLPRFPGDSTQPRGFKPRWPSVFEDDAAYMNGPLAVSRLSAVQCLRVRRLFVRAPRIASPRIWYSTTSARENGDIE